MTERETALVPRVGVGGVVMQAGALLMVERGRPPRAGQWAIPGGKLRWGERLEEAVAREVEEETGLRVEVGELIWSGQTIGPDWHFILLDFEAEVTGGSLVAGDDAAAAAWVPLDEVEELPLTSSMHELLALLRRRSNAD